MFCLKFFRATTAVLGVVVLLSLLADSAQQSTETNLVPGGSDGASAATTTEATVSYLVTPIAESDLENENSNSKPSTEASAEKTTKAPVVGTTTAVPESIKPALNRTERSSPTDKSPKVIHVGGRRLQLLNLYDQESGAAPNVPGQLKRLNLNAFNQTISVLVWENLDLNLHAYGLVEFSKYLVGTSVDNGRYGISLDEISFQNTVRSMIMHQAVGQRPTNLRTIATNTKLFVNEANSTALLITRRPPTNFIEIYGLINDRLIITPVWHQLPKRFGSPHHSPLNHTSSSAGLPTSPIPHVIIDNIEPVSTYMGFEVNSLLKEIKVRQSLANRRRHTTWPVQSQSIVYPELTILVDYYTYQIHGGNVEEIWRYFVIYFSRIQLIFKQLTNPQIQLRLKNIFIANKPFPFQIMDPPRFNGTGSNGSSSGSGSKYQFKFGPHKQFHANYINALKAINEFGFFFYSQQKTFDDSDLILVVTGQDLCSQSNSRPSSASRPGGPTNMARDTEQSRPDFYRTCSHSSIRGQSFVGGACKRDDRTHKLINVAVAEDSGYFDGIRVAAHEIGHLLGSLHDGQWPVNGILGPGGRGCTSNSGYLMSNSANSAPLFRRSGTTPSARDQSEAAKQIKWSVCSTEQIDHFLKLPRSVCLYNRPSTN